MPKINPAPNYSAGRQNRGRFGAGQGQNRPKIVIILGPTASGKSDLGIHLARKFNGEIISADSRQVYRGMDIGTGKITKKEQRLIPHHLLDVAGPKTEFSVSDFRSEGQRALKKIIGKNKVPFIVGGTGFYIDVLLNKIDLPDVPPDKKLRKYLETLTTGQLSNILKILDPRRARTIDTKNKRRLIRALEIIKATGRPVPELKPAAIPFEILWLGLRPKELDKRIKIRLDKRIRQGMVSEVKKLLTQGVSRQRLYNFGLEYRQISEYLANKKLKTKSSKNFKKSEYYQKLLQEIIKYSKRQMTWFKKNKEIHWLKNRKGAERVTREFLLSAPRLS